MAYDPRTCGAQCGRCPLGPSGFIRAQHPEESWEPIAPQILTGARYAALIDTPSIDDVERGYLLSGKAGGELNEALAAVGRPRFQLSVHAVISCKVPGDTSGQWERLAATINKARKALEKSARRRGLTKAAAKAHADAEIPHPQDCCRPRLDRELGPFLNIITMGKVAWTAVTGSNQSVAAVVGGPVALNATGARVRSTDPDAIWRILPSFHPGFVNHAPGMRHDFHRDMGKAFRFFDRQLAWIEPDRQICFSAQHLHDWLAWRPFEGAPDIPFYGVDTETDGKRASEVDVEMFQIATPDLDEHGQYTTDPVQIVYPSRTIAVLFVDHIGDAWFLPEEEAKVVQIIEDFLGDARYMKFGHNWDYYDRLAVEWSDLRSARARRLSPGRRGNRIAVPRLRNCHDTLFPARFRAPDQPKGLKRLSILMLDVERWESGGKGEKLNQARNTPERVEYGQTDTVAQVRLTPFLLDAAEEARAWDLEPTEFFAALKPEEWDEVSLRSPTGDGIHPRPWCAYEIDHATQALCVEMHRKGIYIDPVRHARLTEWFTAVAENMTRDMGRLAHAAGVVGFRPDAIGLDDEDDDDDNGSVEKDGGQASDNVLVDNAAEVRSFGSSDLVRSIFYDQWKLKPPTHMDAKEFLTKSGQPGTGSKVILAYLAEGRLKGPRADFAMGLRRLRRVKGKILGNTLKNLRSVAEGGAVYADGRVHPSFNAHTTAVWRLSCSDINVQNQGNKKGQGVLSYLFCAPGWKPDAQMVRLDSLPDVVAAWPYGPDWPREKKLPKLVPNPLGLNLWHTDPQYLASADLDQAHLRICANYWQIPILLEAFRDGKDPHGALAFAVYGDIYLDPRAWNGAKPSLFTKPPGGCPAASMRATMKTFRYAAIYEAMAKTIWQVVISTEMDDGSLPYLGMDLGTIQRFLSTWLETEPEWPVAWAKMKEQYAANAKKAGGLGYMVGPLSGHRSGALNGGKANEVVNNPILESEAMLMRVAETRARAAFPGQIQAQVHDSIKIERPWTAPGVRGRAPSAAAWAMACAEAALSAERLRECMTVHVPGWEIPFTAEEHWGLSWADLG